MPSRVIDLSLSIPPSPERIVGMIKFWALTKGQQGVANYRHIFGVGKLRAMGTSLEEVERMAVELPKEEFEAKLLEIGRAAAVPMEQYIRQLDENGVEWGAINVDPGRPDRNERTAEVVAQCPARFVGKALVDPRQGMKAVRELERCVKEYGFKALYASPFEFGLPANDKKFYPLYAKSVELNIPVFVYTTMNYRTDFPMDVGHPRNLDEMARDFPELKIVATCGGWPWVPEMVGVARRHQNIYINMAAHRPKHLATPGSGWDMLIQFGNTLLQDRVVYASGWDNYFSPSEDVIQQTLAEMYSLPLKDSVREKWMYKNALRLFEHSIE